MSFGLFPSLELFWRDDSFAWNKVSHGGKNEDDLCLMRRPAHRRLLTLSNLGSLLKVDLTRAVYHRRNGLRFTLRSGCIARVWPSSRRKTCRRWENVALRCSCKCPCEIRRHPSIAYDSVEKSCPWNSRRSVDAPDGPQKSERQGQREVQNSATAVYFLTSYFFSPPTPALCCPSPASLALVPMHC